MEKENEQLKKKVVALRGHVEELEEETKVKDLEVAVWKLRAQELEEELQRYKGKDDDNSTTGSDQADEDNDEESYNGIDHEWDKKRESPSSEVKEEVLVDTTFVPKKVTFDPLKSEKETQQSSKDEEGNEISGACARMRRRAE